MSCTKNRLNLLLVTARTKINMKSLDFVLNSQIWWMRSYSQNEIRKVSHLDSFCHIAQESSIRLSLKRIGQNVKLFDWLSGGGRKHSPVINLTMQESAKNNVLNDIIHCVLVIFLLTLSLIRGFFIEESCTDRKLKLNTQSRLQIISILVAEFDDLYRTAPKWWCDVV